MNTLLLSCRLPRLLLILVLLTSGLHAKIGALGRIIPAGDLLDLSGGDDAVAVVHVKQGALVPAGAPLVTFRGWQTAENEVALAALTLREADELGQLGVEMLTLKTEIAKRDYEFAKARHDRFLQVGGATTSPQQLADRAYAMKSAELSYEVAKKDLQRTTTEREIKMARARNELSMAQAKLERAVLRAPAALTVVRLNAVPGAVPNGPAVSLANLAEMQVVAEVFAGDLAKLKLGQQASITSTSLPAALAGKVVSIGRVINGRAKVAEVLIRLDEVGAAPQLLNLEVNVSIEE